MRTRRGNTVLALLLSVFNLSGCGTEPHLNSDELAQKYPDKKYIQIDGVSLHYDQQGLGPPLILLHGFPISSHIWRNIIPGLTYGTTVYALDLMGFGFSEKPPDQIYTLETYVTQLSTFLDTLHLENPILAGQDIGALIATLYTIRNPAKVRKLILMNTPLYEAAPSLNVRLLRLPVIGQFFAQDWSLKHVLRAGVENQERMSERLLASYLTPYNDDPGARATLHTFVKEFAPQPLLEREIQPNLSQLSLPTLLVWGANNDLVPLTIGRRLAREIPHAELQIVLRTGHYVQEERPDEVRAILKAFVDQ